MTRVLAWAGIVIGIVYLEILGGSWDGIYFSPLRIGSVGIAAIGLAAWAALALNSPVWRPRSAMWPAITAAIGSLAVSTLFSREPRVSLEYLGYSIVLAALYLLLVRLFADPYFGRRLVSLAVLLFVGISALYFALVVAHWINWWQGLGRIAIPPLRPEFEGLTYGNPSAVLTLVALLAVPTAAAAGEIARRRLRLLAWFGISVIVATVALLSGSRAGWFALGVTALLIAAMWLLEARRRGSARASLRRAFRSRPSQFAVAAVVLMLVVSVAVFAPALAGRLGAGGEGLRAQYILVALRLFQTSPLLGTGPGTWVIQRPGVTVSGEIDYYIPHAHNLEIQTLAELGLVGAIAGLIVFISVGRLLLATRRAPVAADRLWAWATFAGLTYFVFHQFLDFYPNLPGILFAAALPVAYLDARAVHLQTAQEWPYFHRVRRFIGAGRVISGAIVAIAIVGLLAQEIPALQADEAAVAADGGNWLKADGPARSAAEADPTIAAYDFIAGLTAAHAGNHVDSARYFTEVVQFNDLPEAWLDLAAEQVELGQIVEARVSLARAMRLGYQRPAVTMAVGALALRMGDDDVAMRAFVDALGSVPSLAGDPWWSLAPQSRISQQVFDDAIRTVPVVNRWEVALMAGQTNSARALAQALPSSGETLEFIDAWTGQPGAADAIFNSCRAQPLNTNLLDWCGRVARHLGNGVLGDRFGNLAQTVSGEAYLFSDELRVNQGVPVGRIEGFPAAIWGTFTYRRTTPMDILVPSLVHLKLA